MKVTNGEVFVCKEALQHLIDRDDIPIKYAMPLIRMAKKLGDEYNLIDDKRIRLIRKYGEEKDDKLIVDQEGPKWGKFIEEFNELMDLAIDINIEKVKVPSAIVIPNKDLLYLEPFLEVLDD